MPRFTTSGDETFRRAANGRLRRDQAPGGRKSRTVCAADEDVVVQIPDGCLASAGFVKHIVGLVVAVEVGCGHQCPSTGKGWSKGAAEQRWS